MRNTLSSPWQKSMVYIDISRFSEPEGAATNEVGMTLTGWWWKCYNASFEGEKRIDISEFPSPSVKKTEHFHQRSVKVGGGYGKIQTVTVCGKQEKMSRLTLHDRIVIVCGIYEQLSLCEIAKKDRQISRKYFKGDTSQPNHCSGRASLWKGLSLCRRVQNKRTMRKGWMLKAVCSLPWIRLQRTLHKIQQYPLRCTVQTAVCLQCLCAEKKM